MARPMHRRSPSGGFTLLEVVVAFVIMALVFGAVFQTFSVGLRNTQLAGDYATAVVHAESKLAQIGIEEPLEEGVKHGRFGRLYGWRQTVRPVPGPDDTFAPARPNRLYEITLTVFWGSGPDARDLTLQTMRMTGEAGT